MKVPSYILNYFYSMRAFSKPRVQYRGMENPTFTMSQELIDEINSQLEYGDNRSAWVRDAIRLKLALLEEIDGLDDMTDEERREFVIEAVQETVDGE